VVWIQIAIVLPVPGRYRRSRAPKPLIVGYSEALAWNFRDLVTSGIQLVRSWPCQPQHNSGHLDSGRRQMHHRRWRRSTSHGCDGNQDFPTG